MPTPQAEHIVQIPESSDALSALRFGRELSEAPLAEKYTFDFSQLHNCEPFGLLLISSAIRRFKQDRSKVIGDASPQWSAQGHTKCHPFARRAGFLDACGIRDTRIADDPNNPNFVSITRIRNTDFGSNITRRSVLVPAIDRECQRLASVMCQGHDVDAHNALSYSLRELFRNVFEHSDSDEIWFAGQFWPNRERIEVAVLDEGCGIYRSLSKRHGSVVTNDVDAIRAAVRPGVTAAAIVEDNRGDSELDFSVLAMNAGTRDPYEKHFANSGYGLFVVSELCKAAGDIMICSGSRSVKYYSQDPRDEQIQLARHDGTAIRLVFHPGKVGAALNRVLKTVERSCASGSARASASTRLRILGSEYPTHIEP